MRAARLFVLLALLGGCGEEGTADNKADPKPAPQMATPINVSAGSNAVVAPPPPASPPLAEPKPLVSRGTLPRENNAPDYRAIGIEPFWAVTIWGSTAILERPDHVPMRFSIESEENDRAIRWSGEGFAMMATQGPCSDGMSDALWSDRVQLAFADGTLKGCGGLREQAGPDGE